MRISDWSSDVCSSDLQPAFDREWSNARKDIAAILRVGDNRLIDENLQEQIIDIDARAIGSADHRNLAGQRIGAAHPVDLTRLGAAHHAQPKGIARGNIVGTVVTEEIRSEEKTSELQKLKSISYDGIFLKKKKT